MAKDHRQEYGAFFNRVTGQLSTSIMKRMAAAGAVEAIEQIRKRNDEGLDVDGKAFHARTPAYMKRKAKLMRRSKGRFAAESPEDWMRLGGGLYRSMHYKGIKVSSLGKTADLDFDLYIKGSKQQKQVTGLKKHGYDMWGLAKAGSAQGKRERRAVLRRMKDVARISLGAGVIIDR